MRKLGSWSLGMQVLLMGAVALAAGPQERKDHPDHPEHPQERKEPKVKPKREEGPRRERAPEVDPNPNPERPRPQPPHRGSPPEPPQNPERPHVPPRATGPAMPGPAKGQPPPPPQHRPTARPAQESVKSAPPPVRPTRTPERAPDRAQETRSREMWQTRRARNWESEHRDWASRGGYRGFAIPASRYRGQFGRDHLFQLRSYPVQMMGGFPRFQFSGYWFTILDPWPEYWGTYWYEEDDVFIEYEGEGYYLRNPRHIRDRIAISVHLE